MKTFQYKRLSLSVAFPENAFKKVSFIYTSENELNRTIQKSEKIG